MMKMMSGMAQFAREHVDVQRLLSAGGHSVTLKSPTQLSQALLHWFRNAHQEKADCQLMCNNPNSEWFNSSCGERLKTISLLLSLIKWHVSFYSCSYMLIL